MSLNKRFQLVFDDETKGKLADLRRWSAGDAVPSAGAVLRRLVHEAWDREQPRAAKKGKPR